MQIALVFMLLSFASAAFAEQSNWQISWDGTLYGYASHTTLRSGSVLNPANQIARIAQGGDNVEGRFNFKAENETWRWFARPIIGIQDTRNNYGSQQRNEAYLSQWQARLHVSETLNVAMGRELINWGAAQFRSPSSPFYFDNGRNNPMRELSGVDVAKITWNPNIQTGAQLARIVSSGYAAASPDSWKNSWLVKIDQHFDDGALGVVVVKAPNRSAFVGAHGQVSVSDAWLVYAEASSSQLAAALQSSPDLAQPFNLQIPSARRNTALLGAAYTREDGNTVIAEFLHDGHGYTAAEEAVYFQRATTQASLALADAPRLLGRNHLYLVWQSNLMESEHNYRVMATRHLNDGSNELSGYAERSLSAHFSAFGLATLNSGSVRQQAASLIKSSVLVGVKIALP